MLDNASLDPEQQFVDESFFYKFLGEQKVFEEKPAESIETTETTDLLKKAEGKA